MCIRDRNLTLFNVVGFENVVKGIAEVWASPYTARAWAWRQSHMKGPEHVYPAVLLQRTVPSDISGVMITQDVDNADTMALAEYLPALRTAALLPSWGTQTLKMQFGEAMSKLGEIEPKAELFIQDQVRGSPLLFYSQRLDRLWRDANRLAGVQHKLLGKEIGAGFNALNPGLARGVLHSVPDMKAVDADVYKRQCWPRPARRGHCCIRRFPSSCRIRTRWRCRSVWASVAASTT